MAISSNSNSNVVKRALGTLRDYVVVYLKVNTSDFGIPHHRCRIYMVAFQKDDLKDIFVDKPQALLERFLQRKVTNCGQPCEVNFVKWLAAMGYPVVKSMRSLSTTLVDEFKKLKCTCHGPLSICELHPCKCRECERHGERARRCV